MIFGTKIHSTISFSNSIGFIIVIDSIKKKLNSISIRLAIPIKIFVNNKGVIFKDAAASRRQVLKKVESKNLGENIYLYVR